MKKELSQEIEIPEGVEVSIESNEVSVKGPEGENTKKMDLWRTNIEKKEGKIVLSNPVSTKKDKKVMNTLASHIRNMIKGVQEKFEYRLKICYSHFPITVKAEGKEVTIKNFLGEKIDRKATVPQRAEIDAGKEIITITSTDKEEAGQAAANLEAATKAKNKDRGVFQDGIYITNKSGKEI